MNSNRYRSTMKEQVKERKTDMQKVEVRNINEVLQNLIFELDV